MTLSRTTFAGGLIAMFLAGAALTYLFFPAPRITSVDEAGQPVLIPYNAPFRIVFSQPMMKKSVEAAFSITPQQEGSFYWSGLNTLEFVPRQALKIGDLYRVKVGAGAKSFLKKSLGVEEEIDFQVSGSPYVKFVWPSSSSVISDPAQTVTVLFDRPMNTDQDVLKINPPLKGDIRWIGSTAFEFKPLVWPTASSFIFEIPEKLEAQGGGATEAPFRFTLETPAPLILSSYPEDEALFVAPDQSITLQFNQAVALDDIQPGENALLFPSNDLDASQKPRSDGFFNTDVVYGKKEGGAPDRTRLVFKPSFPYSYNTQYRFVLKKGLAPAPGLKPLSEDFELHFKTAPKPALLSTELRDGALELTFASPVSKEEILSEIKLTPSAGIPESSLEDEGLKIRLKYDFSPSTDYLFEFKKSQTSFKTPPLSTSLSLTLKNDLLFAMESVNATQVKAELCSLPPSGFAVAYFQGSPSDCADPQSFDIPVSGDANQKQVTEVDLNGLLDRPLSSGIYIFKVFSQKAKASHVFAVTDTSLILKKSGQDVLVWATDAQTHEPVSRMEIQIFDEEGHLLSKGKTDDEGVYQIKKPMPKAAYALSVASSRLALGLFPASLSSLYRGRAYLFVDKPFYKAGDTVKVSGFVRVDEDASLKLPSTPRLQLAAHHEALIEPLKAPVILDGEGRFQAELPLPASSPSGGYDLQILSEDGEEVFTPSYQFEVKPVFALGDETVLKKSGSVRLTTKPLPVSEIKITPDQSDYFLNGKARLTLDTSAASPEKPIKALLTLERSKVHFYKVIELTGHDVIPVSIEEGLAPNFYASVMASSREGLWGSALIPVSVRENEIEVGFTADAIHVRDFQNRGIRSWVSLIADPQNLPSPSEFFYFQRPLNIFTSLNLNPFETPLLQDRPDDLPEIKKAPVGLLIRNDIQTDKGGEAKVNFERSGFADPATITALAVSEDKFGISKVPLDFETPSQATELPLFLRAGDRFVLEADADRVTSDELQIRDLSSGLFEVQAPEPEAVRSMPINLIKSSHPKTLSIKVEPSVSYESRRLSGVFEKTFVAKLKLPKAYEQDPYRLKIDLGSDLRIFITYYAERLLNYPSSNPEVLASQILVLLQAPSWMKTADSDDLLLSKIQALSHSDPKTPSSAAFVFYALRAANEERNDLLEQVTNTDLSDLPLADRAFIGWVKSELGIYDTRQALSLFEARETLSLSSQAFLLMNLRNLIEAGQKSLKPFTNRLQSELLSSSGGSLEDRALKTYALDVLDSENPALQGLRTSLLSDTTPSDRISIRGLAWILIDLIRADELFQSSAQIPPTARLNGVPWTGQTVEGLLRFGDKPNEIEITNEGEGLAYYNIILNHSPSPEDIRPRESGFLVTREYYDKDDRNALEPVDQWKQGKTYKEVITLIAPSPAETFSLDIPIAAGFQVKALDSYPDGFDLEPGLGSLRFQAEGLSPGLYSFSFYIEALTPGTFADLPIEARDLENPHVYGRTAGGPLDIQR